MTKVHPNAAAAAASAAEQPREEAPVGLVAGEAVALTVWRRSLLFNGKGFTVFDAKGNLVFRVDSYAGGSGGEAVLMDAAGKPLLTIRRKKLSLADQWLIYDGEAAAAAARFSARRHMSLLPSKSLAHVSPARPGVGVGVGAAACRYDVEGSYARRSLAVFAGAGAGEQRRLVAAVRRKEAAFGLDVFRLVVEPGFEPPLAMAVVMLLDQMHAS